MQRISSTMTRDYKTKLLHVGNSQSVEEETRTSMSVFSPEFSFELLSIRPIPQLDFGLEKTYELEGTLKTNGRLYDSHLKAYIKRNLWKAMNTAAVPWLEISNLEKLQPGEDVQSHNLNCDYFAFGSFTGRNTFLEKNSPRFYEVGLTFEHHSSPGSLKVFFSLPECELMQPFIYQIEISYGNIERILVGNKNCYFFLTCPGKIYESEEPKCRVQDYTRLRNKNIWYHIFGSPQWIRIFAPPNIDATTFGNSSVIQFPLDFMDSTIAQVLVRIQEVSSIPIFFTPVIEAEPSPYPSNIPPMLSSRNFDVVYAWKGFISRGFRVTDSLTADFVDFVLRSARSCPESAVKSLDHITSLLDNGFFFSFRAAFQHFVAYFNKNSRLLIREEFDNFKYIRRVIKTVYRQLFFPPELMHDNRVLRTFNPDYAIRVCFRDEDLSSRLNPGFKTWDNKILDIACDTFLNKGMILQGRHFEFLGWSNSQLRDHCVWLYARDEKGITAEYIRRWAGNFSSIKSVPKYCARLAQCFTQTEESVTFSKELEKQVVIFEPDIKRHGFCFSDGIGRISEPILRDICTERKIRVTPRMPSAIQIRYSGCKGMLALDPTLTGRCIFFRQSQDKFHSTSRTLEVVKYSKPARVYLNRQLIAILEVLRSKTAHGLDVFHKLQEKQLMTMSEMLLFEDEALKQLPTKCCLSLGYNRLHEDGILFTTEPFFRGLLLAIHRKVNSNLVNKARLEISPEYGRNMFGVLDETGILSYGEVFIQYSQDLVDPGRKLRVLTGWVVVTKNPCTQPGDVRIFQARDVQALHHMVDVVVFPQLGPRPHPDEMAGSDLDGDEYSCIWLPELFFRENHPPMDFPKSRDRIHTGSIQIEHMIGWLKEFIQFDQVGLIANAHLAHSDTKGLKSKICRTLAQKHSIAVDFPKTGHPAKLENDEKVVSYPDYMNKHFNTHRSNKILGQLFRKAHSVEQLSLSSIRSKPEVSIDQDLLHPQWETYRKVACKERDAYFQLLMEMLAQYGIESESEMLSGNILKIRCALMGRNEAYDIEKILGIRIARLQDRTRKIFFEEFGGEGLADGKNSEKVLMKASACYAVTYSQDVPQPNRTGLLSFPWFCVSDLLGKLKRRNQNSAPLRAPLTSKLEHFILDKGTRLFGVPPFMALYFSQYDNLDSMVYLLLKWGRKRNLFKQELGEINFAGMILVFCMENGYICTPNKLFNHGEEKELRDVGEIYLKIIQHWSSQAFRNNGVSLRAFEKFFGIGELMLDFDSARIMKLHQAAFDTFHSVAISGKLSALELEQSSESETILQEFKGFHVSVTSEEYDRCLECWGDEGSIKTAVEEACGMDSVEIGFQRKRWIVSGKGSFEAHRKLKHLLIEKEKLLMPYLTGNLGKLDFDDY